MPPPTRLRTHAIFQEEYLLIPPWTWAFRWESYKDLIDLIVRRPNADDLARTVPLAELIDVSKLNIRDLPKQCKIDPVFKPI